MRYPVFYSFETALKEINNLFNYRPNLMKIGSKLTALWYKKAKKSDINQINQDPPHQNKTTFFLGSFSENSILPISFKFIKLTIPIIFN